MPFFSFFFFFFHVVQFFTRPFFFSPAPEIRKEEIQLGEKIGEGCFGKVYKGKCRGATVAVKARNELVLFQLFLGFVFCSLDATTTTNRN
jgi:hypothetical protein